MSLETDNYLAVRATIPEMIMVVNDEPPGKARRGMGKCYYFQNKGKKASAVKMTAAPPAMP